MSVERIPPTATASEACQPAAAIERMGGLSDLYAVILGRFLDDSAGTYTRLCAAVAREDGSVVYQEAVHYLAHSFKGLAAMCGADRVAEAAAALETAGRAGQTREFATLLARIEVELSVARELLAPYRLPAGVTDISSEDGG
ncbi:MAG TPA: Hpt domain-containing protein [Pirellulales bacterium]|nr:Hpt domain-containing protein [Pirellulales bacterium]